MTLTTDRYVWAVVRELPTDQRVDIERELRATIADMIEARQAAEPSVDAAEHEQAALEELGDPDRLASEYRGSKRFLIGPDLYPHFNRAVRLAASIAVPIVTSVVLILGLLDDAKVGRTVVSAAGAGVWTLAHVLFWTTLGFAIAERVDVRSPRAAWRVDSLPELPPSAAVSTGDTVASVVLSAVTAGLLVLQQVRGAIADADGTRVPLVGEDAWDGRAQAFVALLLAGGVVAVAAWRTRRWTPTLVAANLTLDVLLVAVAAWLASTGDIFDRRFFVALAERAEWDNVPDPNQWLVVAVIALVAIGDTVGHARRARRD